MTATFATPDWATTFATALEGAASVRAESMTWVHGPIALLVDADEAHGFDATAIRMDLHEGALRSTTAGALDQAKLVPFSIGGSLARWRAAFAGELSIVDAILDSRLRLDGDLPTIVRHRALLDAIAKAAGSIETTWADEQTAAEPANA